MSSAYPRFVSLIVIVAFLFSPLSGYSLPEGESIAAGNGTASFSRPDTVTFNVTQSSDRAIIDYSGFDIAAGETVNFYQQGAASIAVNRVAAGNPSDILGALNANGRVFIINPSGVLFGEGCQVDTAGLLASTLNMTTSDSDFMAGADSLDFAVSGSGIGAVINAGTLSSPGGFVALLGPYVKNSGAVIAVDAGRITLAAGEAMTVPLDAENLISVAVTTSTGIDTGDVDAGIVNTGTLQTGGGKVLLTSRVIDSVFDNAINTSGIIEGRSIILTGNDDIEITDAEISLDGGEANISGTTVSITNSNIRNVASGPGTDSADIYVSASDGDITLVNSTIEAGGSADDDYVELTAFSGNIFADAGSLITSDYLLMFAGGDIGTSDAPINTAVDYLSAWSTGEAKKGYCDVYINELDDITLGFISKAEEGSQADYLGYSVGAAHGLVSVVSGGDMTVNSVVTPYDGVFLQSTGGSIYAGTGWSPLFIVQSKANINAQKMLLIEGLGEFPPDEYIWNLMDSLMDPVAWLSDYSTSPYTYTYYSAIMPLYDSNIGGLNILAGSYSYLSAPNGTIGVGTPASQAEGLSGGVSGYVRSGIYAATGEYPSPGIDLSRYTPEGQVSYYDTEDIDNFNGTAWGGYPPTREDGYQIWPETPVEDEAFDNPLQVLVFADLEIGTVRALPEWFMNSIAGKEVMPAALTLEIGGKSIPPEDVDDGAAQNIIPQYFRAYYELLQRIRVVFSDPARPTEFYAYHPLTPTDMAAFDGISLDAGAYEFISDNIDYKKKMNAYFGDTE